MTPGWFSRDLALGDRGADVMILQRRIGAMVDGYYGPDTEQRVRGLQKKAGLEMTGKVNKATAQRIGERARKGLAPEWFHRDLELWFEGEDVRAARIAFGLGDRDNRFDPDLESAVRRFQSEKGIYPTGIITKEIATAIAVD